MQHYLGLVMGKATLALLHRGVPERDIVRQAALFGACYRDDWASGMTILTAMANLLPHLESGEKFLPLWHGVSRMAHNIEGASPHWDGQPLDTDQVSLESLRRWLRHWALVRHRDGAERCLLTAIANGASPGEVALACPSRWLCTVPLQALHPVLLLCCRNSIDTPASLEVKISRDAGMSRPAARP
jgi:hypothetical protein